jgi:hypothetical protein
MQEKGLAPVKKSKKESVATAVRLPRDDYERLKNMPGGVPVGIKRGLELVAVQDSADEPTRDLSRLVIELARELELELGESWHSNGTAHRTFRRALLRSISKWRPADYNDNLLDEVNLAPLRDRPLASIPVHDADALGVALADNVLTMPDRGARDRLRAANIETLQEIERIHGNRKGEGND